MGVEDYSEYPEFQGATPELSTYKFKRELEKFRDAFTWTESQKSRLQDLIDTVNMTLKIMELVALNRYLVLENKNDKLNERILDIQWEIYRLLYDLHPDLSLVLPHGFNFTEASHAALVELKYQSEFRYRVNFFNSGAGAVDHLQNITLSRPLDFISKIRQAYHVGANKTSPILYLENKSFKDIQNELLVEKVLEPILNIFTSQAEAHKAMSSLIVSYDSNKELMVDDKKFSLQVNGTCTKSCWDAWLSSQLDTGMLSAFELFVNQRTQTKLINLNTEYCPNAHIAQGMRRLLADGKNLEKTLAKTLDDTLKEQKDSVNKDRTALSKVQDRSSPAFFTKAERVTRYDNLVTIQNQLRSRG